MLEKFYPDELQPSTYAIPFEKLYQEGYRGLIFDIDNTLVPHGLPADERAIALFKRLRETGFETCLLSNNKKKRVEPFARDVGSKYICMAMKPAKGGYYKAMETMGTELNNTIFIGDQLFTDVWGAKRIGMKNILTSPINPKEEIQIVIKRYFEKIVLRSWKRKKNKL